MDDEDDFDEIELEGESDAEDEFLAFMSRLSGHNRNRMIRTLIETREESRRLGEMLGLDGFELGPNY